MPAKLAVAAAGYGAAFGLLPIGWLVVNAIFIYQLSVETGQFVVLQTADRRHLARPPHPGADARVRVRRLHRGRGRLRRAGGDQRRADDRARLQAARGRQARADRQHRAGRVRIARHPARHDGSAHGARSAPAQRDGRPPAADLLAHRPVLARRRAGRLAPHDRGLAGLPHRRRHVRDHAVRHEQLARPVARRHRERRRGDVRARGADAVLEAGGRNDQRRARGPGRHRGGPRGHRSRLEGVAAVDLPHRVRLHLGHATP